MEIALDFAINCSPDHPYVAEHPEWFYKRPDGTIKYAENPPKKYEDIYPLNFRCSNWQDFGRDESIILFWASTGVRIFRVDNPHTKPSLSGNISLRVCATNFPTRSFSRKPLHGQR
jgi:starch synthase (maltosyl-transferring)